MKTEQEVKNMLAKFDKAVEDDEEADDIFAIRETLEWVLGHHLDETLEGYIPE